MIDPTTQTGARRDPRDAMTTARDAMTTRQRWILAIASLASVMVAIDGTVVTTALSTIHRDLRASLTSLEWTVNAYVLTFAVLLLTGSALGERFGRRRMFVTGLAIFTLSSAACAMSTNVAALITARTVQGAGAAMILPLAMTQLTAAFPADRRGRALGIFGGLTGVAVCAGPFVGGAVAQGLAWQWIFWINVPIGAAAICLALWQIVEGRGRDARLDLPGVALVTAGCFGLVWALVRGNDAGWHSPEIVGTAVGGIILLTGFVAWEQRVEAPMLPIRFFRVRAFAAANVANVGLYASLYGTLFVLSQYLQDGLGNGPVAAGLRLMPWTGTLMICGPVAGRLVDRFGERRIMMIGLSANTIGMGWIAVIVSPHLPYAAMVVPLVVSGCGLSMTMPALQKAVIGAVAPAEIGKASGALNALRMLGGAFGIAIVSAAFAGAGSFASPDAVATGCALAMVVASCASLIGTLGALAMPRRAAAADRHADTAAEFVGAPH